MKRVDAHPVQLVGPDTQARIADLENYRIPRFDHPYPLAGKYPHLLEPGRDVRISLYPGNDSKISCGALTKLGIRHVRSSFLFLRRRIRRGFQGAFLETGGLGHQAFTHRLAERAGRIKAARILQLIQLLGEFLNPFPVGQ